jgi:hypothetical protein
MALVTQRNSKLRNSTLSTKGEFFYFKNKRREFYQLSKALLDILDTFLTKNKLEQGRFKLHCSGLLPPPTEVEGIPVIATLTQHVAGLNPAFNYCVIFIPTECRNV